MARPRIVSRLVTITKCMCVIVDLESNKAEEREVTIPVKVTDCKKALKILKSKYDNDRYVFVNVNHVEHDRKMFGIPEEEFINLAIELDPQSRKPLSQ